MYGWQSRWLGFQPIINGLHYYSEWAMQSAITVRCTGADGGDHAPIPRSVVIAVRARAMLVH